MRVGILPNIYMTTTNIRRTLPHLHIRCETADSKGRIPGGKFHFFQRKTFWEASEPITEQVLLYEASHATSMYLGLLRHP